MSKKLLFLRKQFEFVKKKNLSSFKIKNIFAMMHGLLTPIVVFIQGSKMVQLQLLVWLFALVSIGILDAQTCNPNVPITLGGEDQIVCKGERVQLGCDIATNYCYKWYPESAFYSEEISRMSNPWTLPLMENTEFTLILSDDQGNMLTPITVNVTVKNIQTDLGSTKNICLGTSIEIEANTTGGTQYAYLWNTGQTTSSIEVSPKNTTTYNVVTTDVVSGCTLVSYVIVAVNQLYDITISATHPTICQEIQSGKPLDKNSDKFNNVSCDDKSSLLYIANGLSTYSYLWSTGENIPMIEVFESGLYTVTVTNNLGCSATASYEVENCLALNISIETLQQNTILDAGSGFTSYEWNDGSTGQTLPITSAGTYAVTVMDENAGCMARDEITFY